MKRIAVRHLLLATVTLSIILAASRSVSIAQPASQPSTTQFSAEPSELISMLLQLGSDDPVTRDHGKLKMMGLKSDALPALRQAVATIVPVSSEDQQLIREIVAHILLSDDCVNGDPNQGFMGIAMGGDRIHSEMDDNAELPLGVLVDGRLPGFESYQMLRNGDVILGFSSEEVRDDADVRLAKMPQTERVRTGEEIQALVSVLPAGHAVTLTILRSGRRMEVTFKLGARPLELGPMGAGYLNYRQEQQRKADTYWQENFANIVDRSIS